MAKNSTVTTVANGNDITDTWGNLVKTSAEAPFLDKKVHVQAYSSTTTFDLDNGSLQLVSLTGDVIVALSNQELYRPFFLIFKHDGTSRAITFFSTIKWSLNDVPTPSAANKYDSYMFIPISYSAPNWTYLGFIAGQEQ